LKSYYPLGVTQTSSRHLTVREAALADAARIADLATQLGYPSSTEQVLVRLRTLPQDGSHAVYVAQNETDAVVGWLHVFALYPVAHDRVAEIAGLVVDATCRSSGVGKRLMEAAEHWARGKGLSAVVLRSNVIRESAHKFYEKLGYTRIKTQHAFRKIL
jgi:N-acetylglutamate synthase-like GNAT family acetyltransferase